MAPRERTVVNGPSADAGSRVPWITEASSSLASRYLVCGPRLTLPETQNPGLERLMLPWPVLRSG